MTRKKVKLAWIVNDSARKASLKKRRASLLKKVRELSTLCGVRACIIIYSPDDVEPAIWPSPQEVQQLLLKFQGLPELERSKKMMDQESYIKDRVARVQAQLRKQQRKNKELEMTQIMDQIFHGRMVEGLGMRELDGVAWWVDEKKKEIRKRVQFFQQIPPIPMTPPPPPPPPPPPVPHVVPAVEMGHHVVEGGTSVAPVPPMMEQWMWDDWFAEMMNPSENMGIGSGGHELGPPQGNFGSSSVVMNDMGLPLDLYRSWPNIFSP